MNLGETFSVGIDGLVSHKLRTLLTMLGMIFGVAAVIAMLSIGEGAKQEALAQIKQMGMNNIIVQHWKKGKEEGGGGEEQTEEERNLSQGLSLGDARAIAEICPLVQVSAPQREVKVRAQAGSETMRTMTVGTTPEYKDILNSRVKKGFFLTPSDLEYARRVCVLGSDVKRALFHFEDPIGKKVKMQNQWFTVIGVMEDKGTAGGKVAGVLEVRNLDEDIYVPLTTAISRFPVSPKDPELNQVTVRVTDSDRIREAADIIRAIVSRRHRGVDDFKIVIPEELLRQSQRTQRIFNVVMGCIAGISLLVGGIGIMNIMLATVLERTREIGVRRALGARRKDVLAQFVVEALIISFIGGIIGVFLGFSMTRVITHYAHWKTVVLPSTVVLAFGVSAGVGMIFGIYPARKAAYLDPIDALRYE